MSYCTSCGTQSASDAAFCSKCGNRISGDKPKANQAEQVMVEMINIAEKRKLNEQDIYWLYEKYGAESARKGIHIYAELFGPIKLKR